MFAHKHDRMRKPNKKTQMRHALFVIILIFSVSCKGQDQGIPDKVPYGMHPETPSKTLLDKLDRVDYDSLSITEEYAEEGKIIMHFSLNGKPFNGWSSKVLDNTDHRYRYTKFEDGLVVWQIGYYDNGDLGHDFHMKDGRNYGSQRMWYKGGGLYIDTYFLLGGYEQGNQRAWHSNGVLSRDAFFEKGKLVYEVRFDGQGNVIYKSGDVPKMYE